MEKGSKRILTDKIIKVSNIDINCSFSYLSVHIRENSFGLQYINKKDFYIKHNKST